MKIFGWNLTFSKSDAAYSSLYRSTSRGSAPGPSPTDSRNELTDYARSELTKAARFFDKRSGFVRGLSQDMALYSVGDGFIPQPQTTSREWNRSAKRAFKDWAARADITGRHSLTTLLHIISRTMDRDGEAFVIKTRNRFGRPALQVIEAHRCTSGENPPEGMVDGILFDSYGAPASYRFLRDDGSFRDVPAGAVCHIHDPESVSAARARPALTHGIDRLLDEREILSAGVKGVKDQFQVTRAVTAPDDAAESAGASFGAASVAADGTVTASDVNSAIGGATVILPQGSSITNLTCDLPGAQVMGLLEHLKKEVAGGVLPYEFAHDPSKVGGAVVRLVVAKADRVFGHRQTLLIEQLLNGVWAWVIGDCIARGELEANADFWRVEWITPRRVTVDAGRDSNANREDVKVGMKNIADDFGERSMDYEEELERMAEAVALRKEVAARYGIDPRDLYNPAPNNAQPVQPSNDPQE